MGDKIDNIPGCPGVGEKTAVKLIADFDDIDGLLAGTDRLKGALKKKIEDNAEQIRFSRFLATIRTDVPIEATPDDLRRRDPDPKALMEIFSRLEFRTLSDRVMRRLNASAPSSTPPARRRRRSPPRPPTRSPPTSSHGPTPRARRRPNLPLLWKRMPKR